MLMLPCRPLQVEARREDPWSLAASISDEYYGATSQDFPHLVLSYGNA